MEPREAVLTLSEAQVAALAAEREARRAAALVAVFVGLPAAVAAGAVLLLFALTSLVLLAPGVAALLTWTAWRYGRPDSAPPAA